MGWFSRSKNKDTSTSEGVNDESTQSMTKKRQKELENMLLEFVLEAYQKKNFSVNFKFDDDREDKEYKANFDELLESKGEDYRNIIIEKMKDGSVVIIDKNDSRKSSSFDSKKTNDYKNGGLNFSIYTKNDSKHIVCYEYNNLKYDGGIKNEFNIYMNVYDGTYHNYTGLEPEHTFMRRWLNYEASIDAEIKRMKKLEDLVSLMVEEQEVDLEARNLSMIERMLGYAPKKTKREAILKELLKGE